MSSLEDEGWIPLQDAARMVGMTDTGLVRNVEHKTPDLVKRVDPPGENRRVYIDRDAERLQRAGRRPRTSATADESVPVLRPMELSRTLERLIAENLQLRAEREAATSQVRVKSEIIDRLLQQRGGHGGDVR